MAGSEDRWSQLLKALRIRRGWSQALLAERLGVDQTTVSRWERRRDTPGLRMRRRIVDLHRADRDTREDDLVRMRVRNSLWPTTLIGPGAVFLEANPAALAEARLPVADLRGRTIYGSFGSRTDEVTEKWERVGIFQGHLALTGSVNLLNPERPEHATYIQTLDMPHFTSDGEVWCVCEVKRIDRMRYDQLVDEFGGNTFAVPFEAG